MHPRDLAPLPEDCRQIRIDNDSDIALLRERLAHGYSRVRADPAEVARLKDLLGYLSHTAQRLGELRKTQ